MKVLVTGANGFLGKFVTRKLIETGHSVIATDIQNSFSECEDLESSTYTYHSIDLTQSFRQVIPLIANADAVVHLAAIVGIQNQIAPAINMFDLNVVAAGNIVRSCSELDKYLIFASTSEIFGKNPQTPWNENSGSEFGRTTENRWAYGIGKSLIEELIFGMSEGQGLRAACIRFFNLYGPGQGDMYLIPKWINAAIQGLPIEIYGSGLQRFSFTYVEDAAQVIASLVQKQLTGPLNFGSNEIISILRLSEVLQDFFPELIVSVGIPNREGEITEFARIPTSIRADQILVSFPFTTLNDGLNRTVAFYRRNY